MGTVANILTATGYRLGGGTTISSSSDPTETTCIQWLNEIAQWVTGLCAEEVSDLGRTMGTITTLSAVITAATKASPCSLESVGHGFVDNDTIVIKSVSGMTELNDTEYTVTKVDADNFTIGVDSSAYTTFATGTGYASKREYSTIASTLYTPAQMGWVVQSNYRSEIYVKDESYLTEYDPVASNEPDAFYIDGANNVCFLEYPDDAYTIKIPYWRIPATLTATTDTMPFLGLMDNVFIEALTIRAQNRDEYDLAYEFKWQSFLLSRARRVIAMRKKMTPSITK